VLDKVKQVVSATTGISLADVRDDASAESIETWDSATQINIVAAVEEEFGVRFTDDELVAAISIPAIIGVLKRLSP